MTGFGERLRDAIADRGAHCVGVDPHAHLLEAWGLQDTAAAAETFGLEVVRAAAQHVGVVKPQVAFFERHGAAGYAALEQVIAAARDAGLIVIADVKRGDMGTSVAAYGEAWLRPGSPLEADAMTASAYQGLGSLLDVLRLAESGGKGVFVLCATSNPEARETQLRSDDAGVTVAAGVERAVAAWNLEIGHAVGSIGLVVGATVRADDYGVSMATNAPILAPGFGHQGVPLGELSSRYPADAVVVASSSRSLTASRQGLEAAIASAAQEVG